MRASARESHSLTFYTCVRACVTAAAAAAAHFLNFSIHLLHSTEAINRISYIKLLPCLDIYIYNKSVAGRNFTRSSQRVSFFF